MSEGGGSTGNGTASEGDASRADASRADADGADAGVDAAGPITPSAPDDFGLVQVWWGDGKGKTTAALGMGMRAAGHGYRVHLLQFMKGGAGSVEDVRGEYRAIDALPGFTHEHEGHYGWHGMADGSSEDDHAARAEAALDRTREILAGAADADLTAPLASDGDATDGDRTDGDPTDGVHLLILDEILYAANRDLIDPAAVGELVDGKPDELELVLTGGHERPEYVSDRADLVTNVRKERHPFDHGHAARKGTEF